MMMAGHPVNAGRAVAPVRASRAARAGRADGGERPCPPGTPHISVMSPATSQEYAVSVVVLVGNPKPR